MISFHDNWPSNSAAKHLTPKTKGICRLAQQVQTQGRTQGVKKEWLAPFSGHCLQGSLFHLYQKVPCKRHSSTGHTGLDITIVRHRKTRYHCTPSLFQNIIYNPSKPCETDPLNAMTSRWMDKWYKMVCPHVLYSQSLCKQNAHTQFTMLKKHA